MTDLFNQPAAGASQDAPDNNLPPKGTQSGEPGATPALPLALNQKPDAAGPGAELIVDETAALTSPDPLPPGPALRVITCDSCGTDVSSDDWHAAGGCPLCTLEDA